MDSMQTKTQTPQTHDIYFHGTAFEYFKIWIVNTLLTIVTLGVYSAWAKVRKRKYFYRNTFLAGEAFDYHADPIKILKGRLIIAVFFLMYILGPSIHYSIALVAVLLFILFFPWLIVRGSIFNYRNTSYRNIRFNFEKDYATSYAAYTKSTLFSIFTLGFGVPFIFYEHYNFILNRISYGKSLFKFNAPAYRFFYIIYFSIALYIFTVFVVVFPIVIVAVFINNTGIVSVQEFAGAIGAYVAIVVTKAYVRARFVNLISCNSFINSIQLFSNLKARKVAFIYLTNIIAIIFSLGLATPWAVIRMLKYRIEHTELITNDSQSFESFEAHSDQEEGYIADASADFWDFDLGL